MVQCRDIWAACTTVKPALTLHNFQWEILNFKIKQLYR